jgi:hypothetical protein
VRTRALTLTAVVALGLGALAGCGSSSPDAEACDRWGEVTARGPVRADDQTRADVQAIIDIGPSAAVEAPAKALQVAFDDGLDPSFPANRLTAACDER